jgi:hypothetical protein
MRTLSVLVAVLIVAGCSDTIRQEFKTLDDAKRTKAFDRGWLPPLLPDGSTQIVEVNDLDINTGFGSFRFPSETITQYLEALETQHGAVVTKSPLGITIVVTNAHTRWGFKLDPKMGTGTYSVQLKTK